MVPILLIRASLGSVETGLCHLKWWSEFRQEFHWGKQWRCIHLNNKEIRINNMPTFFKHFFFENVIVYVHDLLFDKENSNSLTIISNKIIKINFLIWA